ncbi:unnamed protein product [Amoebophrya sp. A25]|nr:unnamed protein product [Amoebophrya sp. A25]|eukprot:GSA25T00025681001.1
MLFPCCGSEYRGRDPNRVRISAPLLEKIDAVFGTMDTDESGEVDFDEALQMFGRFTGVAAKKLLEDMDMNNDRMISREEWRFYFRRVLAGTGYTEQDVDEELDLFQMGEGMRFQLPTAQVAQQSNLLLQSGQSSGGPAAALSIITRSTSSKSSHSASKVGPDHMVSLTGPGGEANVIVSGIKVASTVVTTASAKQGEKEASSTSGRPSSPSERRSEKANTAISLSGTANSSALSSSRHNSKKSTASGTSKPNTLGVSRNSGDMKTFN